jgi:hypothetical protein
MEIKVTRVDDFGNDIVETSNETTETNDTADTSTGDNTTDNNADNTSSDTSQNEVKLEIDDNSALEYIKNKFGREADSLEALFETKAEQNQEELPEDVASFYKFKKETGRGLDDYMKVNRDFEKENPNVVLAEYYKQMNPELDNDDIEHLLSEFSSDEDIDTDAEIRMKGIKQKKEIAIAKDYFKTQKEKYKAPLASSESFIPAEEKESYIAYLQQKTANLGEQENQQKRSSVFSQKTNELFSDKFEGFGFKIGENQDIVYKPGDVATMKEQQSDLGKFIGKFLDGEGNLNNANDYHRALAVANDPEKFAKFFYEQGKADQVGSFEKESKNIDMTRGASQSQANNSGIKVELYNPNTGGTKYQ